MRSDPARGVAYDVLRAVDEADAYANLELARRLRANSLDGRDAALATELVSGTLRMQGAYDAIIDSLATRGLQPPVRDVLRLGCHQLLSMRVPDHAAVGTSVELVRAKVGHRPAGLVNAVLRKVAGRTVDEWMDHLDASRSVRTSHPAWVVEELARALGREDELDALLTADNAAPRVTAVARPGLAAHEELPGEATVFSPYGVALDAPPTSVPAIAQGRAGVQDEGSQLVAIGLADAPVDGRDEVWLDLCAGPGGKAALLAALAARRPARLVACEVAPHRARLVRDNLIVLPGERAVRNTQDPASGREGTRESRRPGEMGASVVGVVAADAARPPFRPGSADRVLLDVPCTGLGALRRRPEARWRRRPEDLENLVALQAKLLDSALDLVRPGGVVGYATCSPVLAETADIVRTTLATRDDVELVPVADCGPVLAGIPDADGPLPGTLQLWPHRHGTDAMFLAVLRRTR